LSSKFAEWLLVASAMWILLLVLRVRAVARLERRDSTPGSGLVVGKCSFWRVETSAKVFLAGYREFRPLFRCVNYLNSQEVRALEQSRPAGFEDWSGRRSKDNWEALSSWDIHTS